MGGPRLMAFHSDPLAEFATVPPATLLATPPSTLPPIPHATPQCTGISPAVRRALHRRKNAVFNFMDADRNDMVTFREFCKGVALAGVRPLPDKPELVYLFQSLDANADGRVSFAEFKAALEAIQPPPPRRRVVQPVARCQPLPYADRLCLLHEQVVGADPATVAEHAIQALDEITGGSRVCSCRQFRETLKAVGRMMPRRDFIAMLRRY